MTSQPTTPALVPTVTGDQITPERRIWIDQNGVTTCDHHAGFYLAWNIRTNPTATHVITPLADWIATSSAHSTCEECPGGIFSPTPGAP
ncbi:hypothetical protein [Nesterenkonia sp. K-15-9-6]|uniref:hypothetical protein n=1 Tax=Nesterenkonia sp. K-15-9-6 TaxID=3093918 RepID=UPI0040448244